MFHKELLLGVQSSTLSWWTHSLTIGKLNKSDKSGSYGYYSAGGVGALTPSYIKWPAHYALTFNLFLLWQLSSLWNIYCHKCYPRLSGLFWVLQKPETYSKG